MLHQSEHVGQLGVIKTMEICSRRGWVCSLPTLNCRYDLLIDRNNGKIDRVQIKTTNSKKSDGTFRVRLKKHNRTYNAKEIDILVIYIPSLEKLVGLYPKHFNNKTDLILRFEKSDRYENTNALQINKHLF